MVTDDDDLAATLRLLRAHGVTADYVHTRVSTNARLSDVAAAALRVGLRRLDADNARRREIAARYRAAAPTLRWQADHPRHVYHLCVARVPDRDAFRARVPFATGVHYPRALDAAARLPAIRAVPVPGSRAVGGGVRIVPLLSRADRRRDRGGVSSAPVNPAVEAVSVFFPCYNDEATIASMVALAVATLDRVGVATPRSSSSTTARPTDRPRCSPTCAHAQPLLRVVTHEHNRGYGGALLSGFAASTKQWVFYTDGDGQFDPAELELLVQRASDDVDVVQGYKLRRADGIVRTVIGRVYHRFVKLCFGLKIRDTDCDFRLIRRAAARPSRRSCTRPA